MIESREGQEGRGVRTQQWKTVGLKHTRSARSSRSARSYSTQQLQNTQRRRQMNHDIFLFNKYIGNYETEIMMVNGIIQKVTKLKDFYSISTVRDLIFHVKEHRFNLIQISKILDDFELIFLGFNDINSTMKKKFSIEFPKDKNFTSLKNWHQFETDNPNTFPAMYNFWVKKINN